MKYLLLTTILICVLKNITIISGNRGVKIKKFKLPDAIHNGTGPVELICEYDIGDEENGLVVKWYHNTEQIYQWIPPMPPHDIGIISGLTEYPDENINRPFSISIIRIKKVHLAMTGDYTCSVSTFREDATEEKKMTVYVPDDELNVQANFYNNTHINLTCIAKGARPRPTLTIIVDSHQLKYRNIHVKNVLYEYYLDYRDYPLIRQEAILPHFNFPTIIKCEITIPGTGYRRREKLVYYPDEHIKRNHVDNIKGSFTIYLLLILVITIK